MTKSTGDRISRRLSKRPAPQALKSAYDRGYRLGMVSFANQCQSPEGYKLPDGRIARLVIEGEPTK